MRPFKSGAAINVTPRLNLDASGRVRGICFAYFRCGMSSILPSRRSYAFAVRKRRHHAIGVVDVRAADGVERLVDDGAHLIGMDGEHAGEAFALRALRGDASAAPPPVMHAIAEIGMQRVDGFDAGRFGRDQRQRTHDAIGEGEKPPVLVRELVRGSAERGRQILPRPRSAQPAAAAGCGYSIESRDRDPGVSVATGASAKCCAHGSPCVSSSAQRYRDQASARRMSGRIRFEAH